MVEQLETQDIGPAPVADAIQETVPKRGPGRPRKDGLPQGTKTERKPRAAYGSRKSLEQSIGGTLAMLNWACYFVPPLQADALEDWEIVALAKALDAAARQNPTIHKYLSTVLVTGGAMADLLMVAGMIAGRRLARHGVLPTDMDGALETALRLKLGVANGSEAATVA